MDQNETNTNQTQTNQEPEKKEESKKPSYEELELELAKERAERAKVKNAFDRTASELAEKKRLERERMSAEQRQAAEEQEAKERVEAHIKELEKFKQTTEVTDRYVQMGMELKLAKETAEAEVEGDMEKVLNNIDAYNNAKLEAAKAEWLKSRPEIKSGSDRELTEDEQIAQAFRSELGY